MLLFHSSCKLFTFQIVLVFVLVGFNCVLAISFKDIKMHCNYHFYFCCWILWRRRNELYVTPHLSISSLSWQKKKKKWNPSINSPAFLHLASRAPSHACRARCDGVMTSSNNGATSNFVSFTFISAPQPPSTRPPRLLPDQLAGRAGAGVASGPLPWTHCQARWLDDEERKHKPESDRKLGK